MKSILTFLKRLNRIAREFRTLLFSVYIGVGLLAAIVERVRDQLTL